MADSAAVELGRRAIGTELKPSYYRQALKNLRSLDEQQPEQLDLLPGMDLEASAS